MLGFIFFSKTVLFSLASETRRTYTLLRVGEWRSLVAHLFWVQGVASSNLVSPTSYSGRNTKGLGRQGLTLFLF